MPRKRDTEKVADIVRDAGGRIVGRTRLQKIGYLLELSGLGDGFSFEYRHYGPYSEELAAAARDAHVLGLLSEEEHQAAWGGFYSVFSTPHAAPAEHDNPSRARLVQQAAAAGAIALELAATAAFLAEEGSRDPWGETAKLKPEKAREGRLENAISLYRQLRQIDTPKRLPQIA